MANTAKRIEMANPGSCIAVGDALARTIEKTTVSVPTRKAPFMRVTHIDHYNIRLKPSDLAAVRSFYVDVIGLTEGARPAFVFPGYWLYGGAEAAILHLAATLPETADGISPHKPTGQFDHISLKASGVVSARARLARHAVPYQEIPVPGWRMTQLFLTDPAGLKIELTFDMEREDNTPAPK